MLLDDDITALLEKFPAVQFAFAYGSGVIQQGSYNYSNENDLPMIDMVFVVEDAELWHRQNMVNNPDHYTTPFRMSASTIATIQQVGAGLWYNTHVPMNITRTPSRLIKYGVMTKDSMIHDLMDWKWLYAAGRLHKPVRIMKEHHKLQQAMQYNFESAVRTSLLLLPPLFTEKQLYTQIAGLSYSGDPRMLVAENPNKV